MHLFTSQKKIYCTFKTRQQHYITRGSGGAIHFIVCVDGAPWSCAAHTCETKLSPSSG